MAHQRLFARADGWLHVLNQLAGFFRRSVKWAIYAQAKSTNCAQARILTISPAGCAESQAISLSSRSRRRRDANGVTAPGWFRALSENTVVGRCAGIVSNRAVARRKRKERHEISFFPFGSRHSSNRARVFGLADTKKFARHLPHVRMHRLRLPRLHRAHR